MGHDTEKRGGLGRRSGVERRRPARAEKAPDSAGGDGDG